MLHGAAGSFYGASFSGHGRVLWLDQLHAYVRLGALDHEKEEPCPIQIDAQLHVSSHGLLPPNTPMTDDLTQVLDYRQVRQCLLDECDKFSHINLLETLVDHLAHTLMSLPSVLGIRIKVTKMGLFDDCQVALSRQLGNW
jgi:dihydroneopterin aldolase